MRILTIDIGTGTQDILLFDSDREIENCIQMIMPSPTVLVANRIAHARDRGEGILLTGVTMGGGPSGWAVEDHLKAGLPVYATPDAARTLDDDLAKIERMGIKIIGDDEVEVYSNLHPIEMKDLYLDAVEMALLAFGVEPAYDVIAAAVFDHGAAPPGISDRAFRFSYIEDVVRSGQGLTGFAYLAADVPGSMTRLQAVAGSAGSGHPVIVMDTGPAAVLGALEDPLVRYETDKLVVNVGNFHTLAFHLRDGRISGLFEHHTGMLSTSKLDGLLEALGQGTMTNQEVFDDHGHGALMTGRSEVSPDFVAVTGPRREILVGSRHRTYLAVPHGDMMLAGCFGLLRAVAAKWPEAFEAVSRRLGEPVA